jgi:class 3 adenylate cyclase
MMKRQLAAILYADVAGYSRLTGLDEEGTHKKLDAGLNLLTEVVSNLGQKVHEAGDAILAEFDSVTAAINCAVKFQRLMVGQNDALTKDERLEFRIGINLGEVIRDREDIYGDGVNLSARIQELAEPGGICISGTVYDQIQGKVQHGFDDLGHQKLKNIAHSIRVYAIKLYDTSVTEGEGLFFNTLADKKPAMTGGCLCGEIRYEVKGEDLGSIYCHCRMCQRWTGAPSNAGTGFRKSDFRITQGQPKSFASSLIGERAFCPNCGSSLFVGFGDTSSEWIYVQTVTLDHPENISPASHMGTESQMPWHDVHDDLPRRTCEEMPELVALWESVGVKSTDSPRNINVSKKS